jgi:hypothetical protein
MLFEMLDKNISKKGDPKLRSYALMVAKRIEFYNPVILSPRIP